MKKILGILLSLLVLTSCNQEKSSGDKNYSIGINQFAQHQSLNNCREGLIEGLKSEGIEEGKNLTIEYSNADADVSIANQIGQKLANGKNDLLVAIATPSAMATYNAAMDR